ncbi:MAG TPA: hypothetical protein VJU16_06700, partial [Planctomycetota bacterium]|nr:hypothetical protein [Planctomycetota bacterium]
AVKQQLSFEGIQLADPGPEALARLLTYTPGTDLFVNNEGQVVFFDKLSGLESEMIAIGEPPLVQGTVPKFVNFDRLRPSQIDVYFTPEAEIRFDTGLTVDDEGRFIFNVLPLPDPTTIIGGQALIAGTWYPFGSKLYSAWNTASEGAPTPPAGIPPLDDKAINQYWFMDKLHQMYSRLGDFNPYQLWAQRVEAVKAHYRQTYQINRRWMDRMHSIRPYRVGILDPENGTRAPSQAYTDYCIRPNMKTMLRSPVQSTLGVNIFGYTTGPLSGAKAAPAIVQLLDDEVGILHLDYRLDPFGLTSQLIPSAVDNLPSCDIANLNRPMFWSGARISGGAPNMPALHSTHQVAVVITAAPATPNDVRQLYKRTVTPGDVQGVQGVGGGQASGPPWQVLVGPIITARFMWSDSHAGNIAAAFSGGGVSSDLLEPLLINRDDVEAVAKAVAAKIYAMFTNRFQGGMSTLLNQDIEPKGNLLEVSHGIGVDGKPVTSLFLPQERTPLDPMALLPASTRAILFREVQK